MVPLACPARSGRTASWLHRVDACLDFLTVEGSSCLYRQGDQMSGFFMVLQLGIYINAFESFQNTSRQNINVVNLMMVDDCGGPVAWLLWRRLRSWTRQLALGAPCGTNVSRKKRSRRTELRRELRKNKS